MSMGFHFIPFGHSKRPISKPEERGSLSHPQVEFVDIQPNQWHSKGQYRYQTQRVLPQLYLSYAIAKSRAITDA